MTDTLRLRGPDDEGLWVDEEQGIALGHRRLSILDLSPAGHQPMQSADGRYVLTFNGEIYNHLAVRKELEAAHRAPKWRGRSDTETLLAAISIWGVVETLRRVVGMYALALWDRQDQVLQLARDRAGEKPLYYGWVGGAFIFASELKAFRAFPGFSNCVDRGALDLFLRTNAVPAPYSIYKGISKLEPASVLTLSIAADVIDDEPAIRQYWSFTDVAREGTLQPFTNEQEAISSLEDALRDAVALQSTADVPLGAFLSGGVDSSTVVALMQSQSDRRVQTFTVGFDEAGFDESIHGRAVARHLGTEHHEIRVHADDARAVIASLPTMYDEPFADSSQIPTHLVCRAARSRVTVALSGDGGDELFGGYNRYIWGKRIWKRVGWMSPELRRRLGSAITSVSTNSWDRVNNALPFLRTSMLGDKAHKLAHRLGTVKGGDDLYRSLVTEWPRDTPLVKNAVPLLTKLDQADLVDGITEEEHRMMLWDSVTYLPDDILTKVDRAGMSVSLETRVPLLDHRVIQLAWRLPLEMKIRNGQGKWALRQILYKYVPRELIERPKAGFAIPIGDWLRGPLRDWAEQLLSADRLAAEGYLYPEPVREIWAQHLSGRRDWTPRLWSVLSFQAWLEKNC